MMHGIFQFLRRIGETRKCEVFSLFRSYFQTAASSSTVCIIQDSLTSGGLMQSIDILCYYSTGIPHCEKCGGTIKPDVVLYEEGLDEKTINAAVRYIHEADVLIIGGTSLAVYPSAGLIDYFQGDKLVVINKSATPRDKNADLLIQGPIGEVFQSIQNP